MGVEHLQAGRYLEVALAGVGPRVRPADGVRLGRVLGALHLVALVDPGAALLDVDAHHLPPGLRTAAATIIRGRP